MSDPGDENPLRVWLIKGVYYTKHETSKLVHAHSEYEATERFYEFRDSGSLQWYTLDEPIRVQPKYMGTLKGKLGLRDDIG